MWPLPSSRWAAFPAPENSQVPPIAPDSEPLSRPLSPERCCLFLNLIKMGHTELSLCVWLLSGRVMSIRFTREISSFPRFYKTILIHIIYACVIYIMCICVHLCIYIYIFIYLYVLPSTSGEEPACQCRRHKGHGFDPWVRKITWRRARQPTSVFFLACTA